MTQSSTRNKSYWRATRKLTLRILLAWFAASFGAGLLLVDLLNWVSLGAYPLGFWFAQQGAILVFVLLVFVYARGMDVIDRDHQSDDR
ncbi:MAG TPA: DUF4212 domain-containing protein [Limnobacter sp.]|nr:DUF4212 domain-containing protein [Limnobacter sp.]